MLSERDASILRLIIEDYIATGQPVGSETLVKKHDLDASSATIRNVMVSLAEQGYIEQPHTSAGRIPTASAYRYYVEYFLAEKRLTKSAREELQAARQRELEGRKFIGYLVQKLSHFTSQIALAQYADQLYISGWSNVLRKPDFSDYTRLFDLFSLLEDQTRIFQLLQELHEVQDVRFFIGEENPCQEMRECTLALSTYPLGDQTATFGVMGPLRMNYPRIMGALHYLALLFEEDS